MTQPKFDIVVYGASGFTGKLVAEYDELYQLAASLRKGGSAHDSLREAARIEIGLRAFLENGGFKGFTDTFEDLHGLVQLPGIASQRLMADGYGFGAEGDWKTAALVRAAKVMATGLPGGNSFMDLTGRDPDVVSNLLPGSTSAPARTPLRSLMITVVLR